MSTVFPVSNLNLLYSPPPHPQIMAKYSCSNLGRAGFRERIPVNSQPCCQPHCLLVLRYKPYYIKYLERTNIYNISQCESLKTQEKANLIILNVVTLLSQTSNSLTKNKIFSKYRKQPSLGNELTFLYCYISSMISPALGMYMCLALPHIIALNPRTHQKVC